MIEVSFPSSLTRQREIVAKLDSLGEETRRLESIYRRKIEGLEGLKKSLLQEAFEGRL